MSIRLVEMMTKEGVKEFHFVGFDCTDSYDEINQVIVTNFSVKRIEKMIGFFSQISTYDLNGVIFQVIFHEDIGNYLHVLEQSEENNDTLRQIVNKIISIIETK